MQVEEHAIILSQIAIIFNENPSPSTGVKVLFRGMSKSYFKLKRIERKHEIIEGVPCTIMISCLTVFHSLKCA